MISFNGEIGRLEKIAGEFVTVVILFSIIGYAFLTNYFLPHSIYVIK